MTQLSQQPPAYNGIFSRIPSLTGPQTNLAALLLFTLLTIIAAWPVVSDLDGVIIGLDNDVYINPWADWWTLKALTDPDISLWFTDYLFYPSGASLIYHSYSHLNTAVSLALRPFLGPLPAYNITILINLVLIGFSIFQLTRYLTNSTTAAILAGIVFTFNSQIQYQTSHPVTFSVWCLPWMTLYLIRAARENNWRLAVIAAVFVFLGAATGIHILILSAFWLALLLIFMVISSEFTRPSLKILLVFGLTSTLLVLPVTYPLLTAAVSNQNTSFAMNPLDSVGTDLFSIFETNWEGWYFRSMYLGIVPGILFLIAVFQNGRRAKLWLLLTTLSFLFAIGPVPTISEEPLGVTLPWSLAMAPLLRHMYRMMLLFAFGWAMTAAYGWLTVERSGRFSSRKFLILGSLVGLLIYIDFTIAPFPTRDAPVSAFYTDYLDDVPDDIALAILPTGRQEDKWYMYYQTIHHHPITGGVISRSNPEIFRFMRNNPLLRAGSVNLEPIPIPEKVEESFSQLADVNVGYLILDKTQMALNEENMETWRAAILFEPVYEDNLVLVYKTNLE